jgi:hypothetical protein
VFGLLLGPNNLLYNGYQGLFSQGYEIEVSIHFMLRLRRKIPPLPIYSHDIMVN